MNVKIVVDSTADMAPEIQARMGVVPLTVAFGEEEYVQGVTITNEEFYEKLVECDVLPTTSQATPFAFDEVFRKAVDDGADVVAITVSSKLSGTYQSAVVAAGEYPGRVFVVDSESVAIGSGILAEYALQLADQGLSAQQIVQRLEQERKYIRVLALVDTLEYLKRGGRISKTVAFAGTLLSIKPVIAIEDGEIQLIGKARGSKQGNNLLVQEIHKAGGVDYSKPLMLGYTGLSDALLKKYIADSADLWQDNCESLPCVLVGCVIGTHAGPGAVAVAFFANR